MKIRLRGITVEYFDGIKTLRVIDGVNRGKYNYRDIVAKPICYHKMVDFIKKPNLAKLHDLMNDPDFGRAKGIESDETLDEELSRVLIFWLYILGFLKRRKISENS